MRPIEGCNVQLYQWSQEKITISTGFLHFGARGRRLVIKGENSKDGPVRFCQKKNRLKLVVLRFHYMLPYNTNYSTVPTEMRALKES